jgi:hypothetical protein
MWLPTTPRCGSSSPSAIIRACAIARSTRLIRLSREQSDLKWYQKCVEALQQTSPNAMIFCLIHKMDLIAEEERDKVIT